jgi:bacteriocin biosynthesis cyclodehydratase domain-containing protein
MPVSSEIRPRLRRTFSVIGHDPDTVELRTGVWNARSYTLTDSSRSGKLYRIVAALDGTVSRRELAQREDVSRSDVEAALDQLYSLGAIEDRPSSALDAYLDGGSSLGIASELAVRAMLVLGDEELATGVRAQVETAMDGQVTVTGDPGLWGRLADADLGTIEDPLAMERLAEDFAAWDGALVIYVDRAVHLGAATVLNRIALRRGFPWLHAVIDEPFLLVGPTILPHRSACYECFETRIAMNLREKASYQGYKQALTRRAFRGGRSPVLPPLLAMLTAHTSLEACNFALSGSTYTCEKVLGIYVPAMEISYHEVLPVPGCEGCGSQVGRDDSSLYFDPRAWLEGA